ncbi:cell division cycle- protein [Rhizophlyctis rosea]|nr:cell division cycle- protein [Rhizophlyctis rosea]
MFQDVPMAASPMDVSPESAGKRTRQSDYFSQKSNTTRTRSKVSLSALPRQKATRPRPQHLHWNQRRGTSEPTLATITTTAPSSLPRPTFMKQTSELVGPNHRKRDTRSPELDDEDDDNGATTRAQPMNIDDSDYPHNNNNHGVPPLKMRRTQSFGGAVATARAAEEMLEVLGGGVVGAAGVECVVGGGVEGDEGEFLLPWEAGKGDAHKRIKPETLAALLDGHYAHLLDEYHVIDCRFPYEFEGGHIAGAKNVNTKGELDELFFRDAPTTGNNNNSSSSKIQAKNGKRVVVVFHCEFSSHRAPTMASYMRSRDRAENMERYPALYYPEIYVLKGGYKQFYAGHKNRCEPQQYIEMADKEYIADLKRNRAIHKKEFGRSFSEGFLKRN